MTTFNLPDLGEGLAEAEIVRWHVNVGDAVTADQPMVAVETAKAVVEVPAPFSGVIKKLHGQPGDVIATGAPLIEFELAAATARATAVDSGTVVGTMPTSDTELVESAHPGGHFAGTNGASHAATNGATANMSGGRLRAAPAARALAKKLGIDLSRINGSGRGGVIIVDDIIAHSGSNAPQADLRHSDDNSDDSSGAPRIEPTTPLFSGGERLRGLRRAMAASMSVARDNVASCTIFDDADLHRWGADQDVTTRLLRAIAVGAKAEPALNAWFDGAAQNRRVMSQIDVGIAVDTADGLIVPVIRNAGDRSPAELRQEIERMKRAARDRTAAPEDLRQATFMLTNFGMIAGRYATPVVVPPSVAILGAGRLTRDVVAVKDGMEAHLRMPLSLTFDHRCVTGGEAARFMAAVLRDLEKDN